MLKEINSNDLIKWFAEHYGSFCIMKRGVFEACVTFDDQMDVEYNEDSMRCIEILYNRNKDRKTYEDDKK